MLPPEKRNSVTYDANRIRVPPEKDIEMPYPVEPSLRVVSDDIVQRRIHPNFQENHVEVASPDSFEFQQPKKALYSRTSSSSPYSPMSHNALPSDDNAHYRYTKTSHSTTQLSRKSPDSVDYDRLGTSSEKTGLLRSSSRIKSQMPPARRYSSYPSTNPQVYDPAQTENAYTPPKVLSYEAEKVLAPGPEPQTNIPAAGNSFSFSEADDSVLQISPVRAPEALDFVQLQPPLAARSTPTLTSGSQHRMPPYPATDYMQEGEASPPKSEVSVDSNAIGSFLGTYEHSSSSLALNSPKPGENRAEKAENRAEIPHPLSSTPAFHNAPPERGFQSEPPTAHKPYQPKHNRHDSQSSAVSSASSSTLTSAHNNQQRYVRYLMSTQANSAYSSRWGMASVLDWLAVHGFPDAWRDTFKRNEISGNRFLELANYDSASPVWRQLSSTLGNTGDVASVDRFIGLLGAEVEGLEGSNPQNIPSSSLLDIDSYTKQENRKSSSTLWAQQSPATSTKPRPFSYIETGQTKPQKEHGKFFRKHARMSSDNGKEKESAGEASSGSSHLGFKKSGILSTLRKYGGEKAAGIVKQVQTNPSSKRMSSSFSNVLQKKTEPASKVPENHRQGSQGSVPSYHEETTKSPSSLRSSNILTSDEGLAIIPTTSSRSSHKLHLEDIVEHHFLPVAQKQPEDVRQVILLTRDNNSFVPCTIDPLVVADIDAMKRLFIQKLDMLDIGAISYHLTDFDANSGAALTDELLHALLSQNLVSKLKVEQTFRSADRAGTYSSTSSDSKSFETSAGGKMYPATPQYMLQQSNDKSVDYMNFKDFGKSEAPFLPRVASSERVPAAYTMNLSLPQSKRMQPGNASSPNLNKRGLPLINTSQPTILTPSDPANSFTKVSPNPTFTVVRREGREIDFDKRRLNANESKAPRLIPNIYSSSVTDSAVSPISASTIHASKEDRLPSPSGATLRTGSQTQRAASSGSDLEKGASFVARRKAPPPPTASNSLKVNKKKSIGNLSISPGSNRSNRSNWSDIYHLSNDSIGSFSSSQVGASVRAPAKKFDFSNAPGLEMPANRDNNSDDDDVFFKPLQAKTSRDMGPDAGKSTSNSTKDPAKDPAGFPANHDLSTDSMTMRPSVDEVYDNLERYFPNTILDKPIIDAYPESPGFAPLSERSAPNPVIKKSSISRTFSNANISPVHPAKAADDEVFYGDGPQLNRRMKTIRAVAHEAHKKRLASQRAVKGTDMSKPPRKQNTHSDAGALTRANTKLWGQRVVEVTSDDIEKGLVERIRKTANRTYEEFAWVKGELIGRGSFGSVFLALNVTTGEMLAVKQVNVSESTKSSSDGIDAFHKEVETMKDLDHLNIVQYLGFEQSKSTYSLFLEYVAGGSISSCLKSYGKFDEPLVKFITRQVLEGLKYLHENGILHRDLKADNLLLEIDGVCKISDFGISKRSQDIYSNNAEMSMQGTVFWMAPEVIHSMVEEKKQGYSAKVDIWSLGCVMLEMFAGQRPWSNEAVVSAIYKLGKTKLAPPIPADVSQEAKDFLNKCFTIDSSKRPTAAELLDHEFVRIDSAFSFCQTRLSEVIRVIPTKKVVGR